ncbi:hypothetical protein M8C21_005748 [Ambrosia artemisiifolia]|uniref:Uncharacterized protein n=1 Tax=Ambrosia artemisiifolia TaxID=4212 RepID=A0AAD5CX92_AMBAR|nr:hypothetical protein M8C21_005748 [Ambrosia artemisiifolia]
MVETRRQIVTTTTDTTSIGFHAAVSASKVTCFCLEGGGCDDDDYGVGNDSADSIWDGDNRHNIASNADKPAAGKNARFTFSADGGKSYSGQIGYAGMFCELKDFITKEKTETFPKQAEEHESFITKVKGSLAKSVNGSAPKDRGLVGHATLNDSTSDRRYIFCALWEYGQCMEKGNVDVGIGYYLASIGVWYFDAVGKPPPPNLHTHVITNSRFALHIWI